MLIDKYSSRWQRRITITSKREMRFKYRDYPKVKTMRHPIRDGEKIHCYIPSATNGKHIFKVHIRGGKKKRIIVKEYFK